MEQSIYQIEQKDFKDNPLCSRLNELHDIPKRLYTEGTLPDITIDELGRATPRILTIVGSRKHTMYGKRALEKILAGLAGYDVIVVSGLAYGIDSIAHTCALENNLRTIAVPGSGIAAQALYPKNHLTLARTIIKRGGALMSEFEPDTSAAPWTFPARNRIMAALSDAVLIVEAEEKSGTLITARQSLELGKDIGAIPGEIFNPSAHGTNMLIREGATPITSSEDLLELLHLSTHMYVTQKTPSTTFTKEEIILLELLREPLDKDTLFTLSKLPFETFITTYSSLEIHSYIEESFGEVRRIV